MKSKEKIKALLKTVSIDQALQCLIESIDETTNWPTAPIWQLNLMDQLEDSYNLYMDHYSKEVSGAS